MGSLKRLKNPDFGIEVAGKVACKKENSRHIKFLEPA